MKGIYVWLLPQLLCHVISINHDFFNASAYYKRLIGPVLWTGVLISYRAFATIENEGFKGFLSQDFRPQDYVSLKI